MVVFVFNLFIGLTAWAGVAASGHGVWNNNGWMTCVFLPTYSSNSAMEGISLFWYISGLTCCCNACLTSMMFWCMPHFANVFVWSPWLMMVLIAATTEANHSLKAMCRQDSDLFGPYYIHAIVFLMGRNNTSPMVATCRWASLESGAVSNDISWFCPTPLWHNGMGSNPKPTLSSDCPYSGQLHATVSTTIA